MAGDPDIDGLEPSEHERWLALHREEAAAAEQWLAGVLGDRAAVDRGPVDRVEPESREPFTELAGWSIETEPGGVVEARHGASGATVSGALVLRATDQGARLRLLHYHYAVPGAIVAAGPPPPIGLIEETVNQPAMMQSVLDALGEVAGSRAFPPPMRIPPALLRGRTRSDEFYVTVAAFVRACRDHKISYGPRLAADNDVSEGTVRSWVHEARRRGLLDAVSEV